MRLMDDDDELVPAAPATPAKPEYQRRFKDAIHDYMPFNMKISAIIDTPQFQRLRNIKQLGTSYHVWPTASHNRFEHSLGVAYLSMMMAEHLQKSQPELNITTRDVDSVTIAGLCHDLGHGPWSHVWDGQFIKKALPHSTWQHEDASMMMFDALIRDTGIETNEKDIKFIKALIIGDPKLCDPSEKPFLFEIVANKRNGLDVDKFDYIARDTHGVDLKGNLSLTKLIHSARVIGDEICYDIKDANQLYELFYTRFSLHKRIYNHKTAKAIEYMLVDALLEANKHMSFAEYIHDPTKFLHLTDYLRTQIESSTEPELAEARHIFHRITTRKLYRMVDYKVFHWALSGVCEEHFTPERIVAAAKALPASTGISSQNDDYDMEHIDPTDVAALEPRHVIVDMAKMHYGMKDKNPLDSVRFYSKQHPDTRAKADPSDISLLMPDVFGEVLLRIYIRDTRFYGLVQAGYRELLRTMPDSAQPTASAAAAAVAEDEDLDPLADEPDNIPSVSVGSPSFSFMEEPTTPPKRKRPFSRTKSAPGVFCRREEPTKTPFTNNTFMQVPKNYKLVSPTAAMERPSTRSMTGKKREREGSPAPTPRKSARKA